MVSDKHVSATARTGLERIDVLRVDDAIRKEVIEGFINRSGGGALFTIWVLDTTVRQTNVVSPRLPSPWNDGDRYVSAKPIDRGYLRF
jgi:hypothetical protein